MKAQILFALSLWIGTPGYGQSDTIYYNNEKIVCTVREITPDAVRFIPDDSEVMNSLYKNAIRKMVYGDGRVETFPEASALLPVNSLYDFDKVSISHVESEIHGLFKLGDVSSVATGGSSFGNRKVRERALRKLKIRAAMMGANVVYITNTGVGDHGFQQGYYSHTSAATNLQGVAYSNQVPDFHAFEELVSGKKDFTAIQETVLAQHAANYAEKPIQRHFKINKITNQFGLIILDAQLEGLPDITTFRVVSMSDNRFNFYYEEKGKAFNIMVSK